MCFSFRSIKIGVTTSRLLGPRDGVRLLHYLPGMVGPREGVRLLHYLTGMVGPRDGVRLLHYLPGMVGSLIEKIFTTPY